VTTAVAIDWNAWRERYDEMTFADQQAFYDQVFEQFPEQARFSTRVLDRFLAHIAAERLDVVELGGWNGGFATEILPRHPEIASWVNCEISLAAIAGSVCMDPRYHGRALGEWYWQRHVVTDLFVASHVLEHLKLRDVLKVFDATHAKWLYLQSPLGEEASNWRNYRGSHILEVGWRALGEALTERGFALLHAISEPTARCYMRMR